MKHRRGHAYRWTRRHDRLRRSALSYPSSVDGPGSGDSTERSSRHPQGARQALGSCLPRRRASRLHARVRQLAQHAGGPRPPPEPAYVCLPVPETCRQIAPFLSGSADVPGNGPVKPFPRRLSEPSSSRPSASGRCSIDSDKRAICGEFSDHWPTQPPSPSLLERDSLIINNRRFAGI